MNMDKIEWLYAAFALSMVGIYTPAIGISGIAACVWIVAFFVAGHFKKKEQDETLARHHLIWMLRSFWLYNLWLVVFAVIFAYLFNKYGDFSAIGSEKLLSQSVSEADLHQFVMSDNKIFALSAIPLSILMLGWYLLRLWQGFAAYKNGSEINNIKRWI